MPRPGDREDRVRERFVGRIAGVGTSSGVRFVVGRWNASPWGPFADVMIEDADGARLLIAPNEQVGGYVGEVYRFDDVRVEPVDVTGEHRWQVSTPSLTAELTLGPRTGLGWALRCQPPVLARQWWWARMLDPVARRLVSGVRTAGSAGAGRREYYGAHDQFRVTGVQGHWIGRGLGSLRPVDPPVRFGFSSTPVRPSVTSVTTTIRTSSRR